MTDATDWTSNLPEPILHDILSRLPEKDAARTSVLSKSWKQARSTLPILVFNESRYGIYDQPWGIDLTRKINKFYDSVDNTLLRFRNQGLTIKRFKLWMDLKREDQCCRSYPRFDHWMELVKECGVECLDLTLEDLSLPSPFNQHYHLPPSVLEAKSLTVLRVCGHFGVDRAFQNHPINLSSLKVLYFSSIHLGDEQVIKNIVTSCPLIEDIALISCSGFDSVIIRGASKLKRARIDGVIKEVDIDAPSLENFYFIPQETPYLSKFNVDKCTSLKKLSLMGGLKITYQWLLELSHLFPFLEILKLSSCSLPRKIKMSCRELKVLELEECTGSRKAYIDAPKLHVCTFRHVGGGEKIPTISFLNSSGQLEINVRILVTCSLDYRKLRRFFEQLEGRNVVTSLTILMVGAYYELKTEVLRDFSAPPPTVKHPVSIHFPAQEESFCVVLVTGLLWSFRPSIISCDSCSRTFTKVLCEKLMNGKEEDCYCSSSHIKCWWHGLKNVKVTIPSGNYGNEVDCKTFLDALPTLPEGDVTIDVTISLE